MHQRKLKAEEEINLICKSENLMVSFYSAEYKYFFSYIKLKNNEIVMRRFLFFLLSDEYAHLTSSLSGTPETAERCASEMSNFSELPIDTDVPSCPKDPVLSCSMDPERGTKNIIIDKLVAVLDV